MLRPFDDALLLAEGEAVLPADDGRIAVAEGRGPSDLGQKGPPRPVECPR